MPTRRAWSLFILAAILYFLANQTQVGWIYIFTDALIGLLIVAALYSWGMLNSIQANRVLHPVSPETIEPTAEAAGQEATELDLSLPAFHEDDLSKSVCIFGIAA